MAEYKDVLRVCDTKANVATLLREKMIGFATDTFEIAVKAPGGTMYYFAANGIDHFTNVYIDESVIHYGDDGTKISFTPQIINLYANNFSAVKIDYNSAQKIITLNNDSEDVDVLIKDDNGNTSLFVNGASGYSGFGTSSPESRVDISLLLGCGDTTKHILLRSTGVAHGVTGILPTDAFGGLEMVDWAQGGLKITGITELDFFSALHLLGIRCSNASNNYAPICLASALKDGTGVQVIADVHPLLWVKNNTDIKLTVYGNGDIGLVGGIFPTGSKIDLKNDGDVSIVAYHTGASYNGLKLKVHDGDYTGLEIGNTGICMFYQLTKFEDVVYLKHISEPAGSSTGYGRIYAASDNKLYFKDATGTKHEIAFV